MTQGPFDDILIRTTSACIATAAMLGDATPEMHATLRGWIPTIGKGLMMDGRANASCVLPYGVLKAREDNLPGITIWLEISETVSYQMGTLWLLTTKLPDTLMDTLAGRPITDLVELPKGIPEHIAIARIVEARHTGNRRGGTDSMHLRAQLDVEVWRPAGWYG